MPTNYNRANLITESATLFPDNNTQEISPADLRQWLEDGTTSFVTQKDKSTLENAIFENKASTLASGATVDLNTATGNYLHISGTGTINSFGTCPAGARFIIVFDAAATLTYNATSLIIPGLANKTAAAGDCCMIVSEGSGNWRIVGYFAISGGGGGGSVTAVTGTAPIASSGGTAPDISIPQANGSTDGFLDSADWTTFNGKQDAITLTTSGTSGAATLVGATLNIPQYSGGGGGVTSVGATSPITSSGGATPTISTSIATGKLVGRYGAGTGIMQEITVGSGLTLTGAGTLNNTATPTPLGYYAMYQDLFTQTAAASNTGYPMKFRTLDYSNQVTVVSDTRITFANAGIYNLQFSSQFQNIDNAPHDITIWIRLNGTDVTGSAGFVQIPARKSAGAGNEGHIITGWNYLLDVSAGQYYEIVWSTTDHTNVTMQFYAAGSPPPSTASTIFTVTQQAGIMAGTGITGMVGTTGPTQTGATQTLSSSDMTITSAANTHTFAIPDASDVAKGLVNTSAQTFSGIKSFTNGATAGEIRFLEPSGSGVNYVALKSQAITADYSITLPPAAPSGAQYLQSTGTGGVLQWTSGTTTGVSSVGTINSATKNPNGVVISGSNIIMQTADATNVGLVSIGTQTFAGAKTFSDAATFSAAGSTTVAQLTFSGATNNWISFGNNGTNAPAFSTRSSGTKIVLFPFVSANALDHAIGVDSSSRMWISSFGKIQFYADSGGGSVTPLSSGQFEYTSTVRGLNLNAATDATATIPQLLISGATASWMSFGTVGGGDPTLTNRSIGTRIVLRPFVSASALDWAIGWTPGPGALWLTSPASIQFYTNSSITARATIDTNGLNLVTGSGYRINAQQVVGARITGYGTPTGGNRTLSFAAVSQAEQVLAQLVADLKTHGLIS